MPVGLVLDEPEQVSDGGVPDGLGLAFEFVHPGDVEGLDAEDLVLPDQQSAQLVVEVAAESQYLAPDGVEAVLGFVPASGALSSAVLLFLPAGELFEVLVEGFGIEVVVEFGVYGEGLDADVGGACFVGFEFGGFGLLPVVEGEFPLAQAFVDGGLVGNSGGEFPLEFDGAQVGEGDAAVSVVLDSVDA